MQAIVGSVALQYKIGFFLYVKPTLHCQSVMNKNASNSKSGCTFLAFLDGVIGGVKKTSANTAVTETPVVLTLVPWAV
jgi:hypothetical protein